MIGEAIVTVPTLVAEPANVGRRSQALSGRLAQPSTELVVAHDPYDPRSERMRGLRTELLLRADQDGRANVVALLSATAGEGRSQLAAELAITFAQLGRATLLVDADLRNPRQHELFGVDNTRGLSQMLARDEAPYPHAVAGLPQLFLHTAGAVTHNPMELLSSPMLEQAIDNWRRTYDFVVIDTSPIGRYADSLAVAAAVRRVLLVTRANHTPFRELRESLRRLSATQSRILGSVINDF